MDNTRCPDCGAPVSPSAVVCPSCGFPIRPGALVTGGGRPESGPKSSASQLGIILAFVAVGGFVVVVIIGILAALAIPRFAQASARAKEKDGERLLKAVYTAEQTRFAQTGAYTMVVSDLVPDSLRSGRYYDVEVSAAGDRDLCLEAVPRAQAGRDVRSLSMDANGTIFRSAGCTGEEVVYQGGAFETSDAPGASGMAGARELLSQVHESIAAYHAQHGEYPQALPDLLTRVRDSRAGVEYGVTVVVADGQHLCVAAVPRNASDGLDLFSVDQDGRMFAGRSCEGEAIDQFGAAAKPLEKPTKLQAHEPVEAKPGM